MKKLLQEFKTFSLRGNVVDLAIAVIIGAAFGKIVSSLVDTIIMPILGIFTGGVDLSELSIMLRDAEVRYGAFMQAVIDFVIIAFVIFLAVKAMNRFVEKKEEEEAPKAPPEEVLLLTEIRDLLKKGD